MHAKISVIIPIKKQIMSVLRIHLPFVDHCSQTGDTEVNIWSNFNTLPFSCVANEGSILLLLSIHQLLVSLDGFIVGHLLS